MTIRVLLRCYLCAAPATAPPTWMRLFASRAMLEKCGTLARSCGSPPKHSSIPSSSRRMVHTHSSLVGGPLWEAELSCCRASLSASSLHSRHSWKSSSFSSEFCSKDTQRVDRSVGFSGRRMDGRTDGRSHLQQQQLGGTLRRRAHKLQTFGPAAIVERWLQQTHHRVKV